MASVQDSIQDFKRFVQANPHTGTTEQIVELSLLIAATAKLRSKDRGTYALYQEAYREASGVGDKVFSKLKKIGETFQALKEKDKKDVIKGLPAAYQTIHELCSLSPEELVTGIRSKHVTPATSIRAAKNYRIQIKHPGKVATDGEKGRWGSKHQNVFTVLRPSELPLEGEALQSLENELRRVCTEYGVLLRQTTTASLNTIKEEEKQRAAAFWKAVLEKQVPQKWFMEQSDDLKKQFNLKTVDELRASPIRTFTGFFNKAGDTREEFWKKWGRAYVAKLHYKMETTTNAAKKHSWKIMLEQKYERHKELAIWKNVVLKESGMI